MPTGGSEAPDSRPLGLILAGGLGRRLGGVDKSLLRLDAETTLLDVLRARLSPQCATLAISANGDPVRFSATGLPVLADPPGPSRGPLAGVLSGLSAATRMEGWLLTVPGDTPFVPSDLAARLRGAALATGCRVARAAHHGKRHNLVALWSCALLTPLTSALIGRDLRKVAAFQQEAGVVDVAWDDDTFDPFFNVNTPDDLDAARRLFRMPDYALRIVNT